MTARQMTKKKISFALRYYFLCDLILKIIEQKLFLRNKSFVAVFIFTKNAFPVLKILGIPSCIQVVSSFSLKYNVWNKPEF